MSAFFIWLEFTKQPIDQNIARAMLRDIEVFGGDSSDLLLNDNLAIGVQSKWTTPEDIGEKQPLFNDDDSECFLFDGRIDNREHLIQELTVDATGKSETESNLSDGQLMYQFVSRFGKARLPEVIGPFVYALFNFNSGYISCARDVMGGRYLVYRINQERLMIASSEHVFFKHPDVGHSLNEAKVTGWFVHQAEQSHLACLHGLSVIQPGCLFEWQSKRGNTPSITPFYQVNPERRITLESDQDYANEFRRLLDQAVLRRMRSNGNVGSMMSGGLDSVPITISAGTVNRDIIAYSWCFDESSGMDERRYSSPICDQLGIKQTMIACDDLWPALDQTTECNPLFPVALHYSEYHRHSYAQAQADGVTVMLTGMDGDLLYEHANTQCVNKLRHEGIRSSIREYKALQKKLRLSHWQMLKRFFIAQVPIVERWLEAKQLVAKTQHTWLVDEKQKLLKKVRHYLFDVSLAAIRPLQYRIVLDGLAGQSAMLNRHMESKFSIESRSPFRDRELCEFMLAIPTSQLQELGVNRPIVKRAYQVEFPKKLAIRNDKTRFDASFFNGYEKHQNWQKMLLIPPQAWKNYVKECKVYDCDSIDEQTSVVKWYCSYYNFWYKTWYGN